MEQFKNLTEKELEKLLKAPVLVSLLAASRNNKLSKAEKADAIKMSHLKTFTASEPLASYYKEVNKNFNRYFEEAEEKYSPYDEIKREQLKEEINQVNNVIKKLDSNFAKKLHKSLKGYAEHVKRADRNILVDFIFPMPIPGITD